MAVGSQKYDHSDQEGRFGRSVPVEELELPPDMPNIANPARSFVEVGISMTCQVIDVLRDGRHG